FDRERCAARETVDRFQERGEHAAVHELYRDHQTDTHGHGDDGEREPPHTRRQGQDGELERQEGAEGGRIRGQPRAHGPPGSWCAAATRTGAATSRTRRPSRTSSVRSP